MQGKRRRSEERLGPGRERLAGTGVLARLRARGLLPRKGLGQHFLHDPKLLASLAELAQVGPQDRVLEVGTGPGTLTRELALRASEVLTVDVDQALLAFAREELKDFRNIRFLGMDVLVKHVRLRPQLLEALQLMEPFLWVSNLPFAIATTLIVLFCESTLRWTRAALTVQAEVAERLAAAPGTAAFGPVTLLVAYWASVRRGRLIPAGAFWPPPRVDSRVVHLERRQPLGSEAEYVAYRFWVKKLFSLRRKTIEGSLRRILGGASLRPLEAAGPLNLRARPEELGPEEYLLLARELPLGSRQG